MLKRLIAVFAAAIVVIAAAGAWWATRVPASPFDRASQASPGATEAPEATVARGAYVARQADCVACHTTEGGASFAGGLAMGTPIGAIYTTNITPDRETGIGSYSLAEFDNAVRRGVARDGHRLYPAMPYPSYAKMTDEDVQALYGYFMKRVTPVRQENRASDIPWPLNMRWPLAFWNIPFYDGHPYVADTSRSAQWNRGAYLVQGAGHCGSCHTPRGLAMQERALDQGSAAYLSGALLDGWYAPSLRNDPNTGLGRWSESEIVSYLRTGRNVHGVVFGSMLEAFNNSTQHLSEEDLGAMAHYLKSLPGDPERDGKPWSYQAAPARTGSPSNGEKIYAARCAYCHGVDGRGRGQWISPLAGASSVLSKENASTINITLNGSGRVVQAGTPDSYRMPPLRQLLSDGEIADVLTYVRGAWGNGAPAVTPEDVAKLRRTTNPSSDEVIILQMR
ncbi:cytochrome c [Azorhizobium oxalatiphilum]|uniref:Cytochrome c n=1 Tax=Azorhizobium oxalatiphilum TaxID=980631 RepID=A0A917BY07_9HYPH|nr:cytochrome c [Azorhizobium oxalatiphilum]GGF62408.1 cytochrome c [Azorhizobium oxalatiphilum]